MGPGSTTGQMALANAHNLKFENSDEGVTQRQGNFEWSPAVKKAIYIQAHIRILASGEYNNIYIATGGHIILSA